MGIISGAMAAYLVGCVPVARYASRLTAARRWAPLVGPLADAAKGFLALWLFARTPSSVGVALTVTALVAGSQWPVAGESGGHGQWALLGAIAEVTPVAPPLWAVLWAAGFVVSGYFVVGRAVATALLPPVLGFVAGWPLGGIALPGCWMVLERTRAALGRIRAGTEPKHYWHLQG